MQRAHAPLVTDRDRDAPEVTSGERRHLLWWGVLLGLLALGLSIAAALLVSPSSTRADAVTEEGCTVQLTGEAEGPLPGLPGGQATSTFSCVFPVTKVEIDSNKQMLAPIGTDGTVFVCLPPGPEHAECTSLSPQGSNSGTIQILAQDVCGVEDRDPLELDVTLIGVTPTGGTAPQATIDNLKIQCEQAGGTTTTPQTTTGPGTAPTTGTTPATTPGGGVAGTTGTGGAREDSGAFPRGGVQTGAGGTA